MKDSGRIRIHGRGAGTGPLRRGPLVVPEVPALVDLVLDRLLRARPLVTSAGVARISNDRDVFPIDVRRCEHLDRGDLLILAPIAERAFDLGMLAGGHVLVEDDERVVVSLRNRTDLPTDRSLDLIDARPVNGSRRNFAERIARVVAIARRAHQEALVGTRGGPRQIPDDVAGRQDVARSDQDASSAGLDEVLSTLTG